MTRSSLQASPRPFLFIFGKPSMTRRSSLVDALRVATASLAIAMLVAPARTLSAQAASSTFIKGDRLASVGVMTGGDYDGTGVGAMVEWGVASLTSKVQLGLGGFVGVQRNSDGIGSVKVSTTVLPLMATGNLHFALPDQPKLDLYAGASLGFIRASGDVSGVSGGSSSSTDTAVGIQGGARYIVASKLSVVGQVGLGDLPLIFAGVSFKF